MHLKNDNIDFNADGGQGFGIYRNENETEILEYVSSVNIACGFHAGDPLTIKKTFDFIEGKNISAGALIGYGDLLGFGKREINLDKDETEALVLYQLGALSSFSKNFSSGFEHVRMHGAMYDKAAKDFDFALNVANAVKKFDKWLVLYLPFGEIADKVEQTAQITVAREYMPQKEYDENGNFFEPEIALSDELVVSRIKNLIQFGKIPLKNGGSINIDVDTVHFDTEKIQSKNILTKVRETITPSPVNYNKATLSGWV